MRQLPCYCIVHLVVGTAPEAMEDHEFTTMSDVWSFAVVLREVMTNGSLPYEGVLL